MLTQEQIEKLEPLTHHPRFGQILQDAMKNWMLPNINPKNQEFGVKWLNDCYVLSESPDPINLGCCLIGSYILNKKSLHRSESLCCEIATQYSKIDYWEVSAIVDGFDQSEYDGDYQEAYAFGKQVSLILFGDLNAK